MIKKLLVITLLLISTPAIAENIYVAQTAAGGDTGADCANAHSAAWFNTAANWANPKQAGKIGPADTAHLCSTITSSLAVQASGSAGSVITILFESGAKLSTGAWGTGSASALYSSGKSYITIDGGTNGIIECTNNGDSGSGKGLLQSATGIYATTGSYWEIKNLTVQNIFMHTYNNADTTNSWAIEGISISHLNIHNNTVNNAYYGIWAVSGTTGITDINIYNNTITACSTGVVAALQVTGNTLDGVDIYGNTVVDGENWFDTANNHHIDGMHIWAISSTADQITNVKLHNNYIHGNSTTHSTGYFYIEYNVVSPLIYNNILVADGANAPNNGHIVIKQTSPYAGGNPKIFNNTIIGRTNAAGGGTGIYFDVSTATTPTIQNNIIKDLFVAYNWTSDALPLTATNNDIFNVGYVGWTYGANTYSTLDLWKGAGFDANSISTDPTLSTNYSLLQTSPCINTGVTLTWFSTDYAGTSRPFGSAWDIGAYEYTTGTPPIQLTITTSATSGCASISCTSPVNDGSTTSCTATPNTGYRVSAISGCGYAYDNSGKAGGAIAQTSPAITQNCTATAYCDNSKLWFGTGNKITVGNGNKLQIP